MERFLHHEYPVLSGTTTSSKKKSASRKLGFKTLQAISHAGLKYKNSEGTKEKPSKATMPAQRQRISVERSKGSENQPHNTTTATKECGTKA